MMRSIKSRENVDYYFQLFSKKNERGKLHLLQNNILLQIESEKLIVKAYPYPCKLF